MRLVSPISRRDFLNGAALSVAAGALSPAMLAACAREGNAAYPPAATGLRGAHVGAFETAHAVAWEGRKWESPDILTDGPYDLVIVGAGLSGLAAAQLFRERAGEAARILILDNHDDFGGHAKRNEFVVNGRRLIGYGGSQSIDSPARFSPESMRLLKALGVETGKFYQYFDQELYARRGMRQGLYLDKATYGADALGAMPFAYWSEDAVDAATSDRISALPLADDVKAALSELTISEKNRLSGMSAEQKTALLRTVSYEAYLRQFASAPEGLILLLRRIPHGIWGVGWDALSALEAARWGMPGTEGLDLPADALADPHYSGEPYIFHFPDGNASLARLLVRKLIPGAIDGKDMEDIVGARVDYGRLDRGGEPIRLRLNSTAVSIGHAPDKDAVDVVYVKDGAAHRVRARSAIWAGYMGMLPYVCAEIPEAQKEAIRFFTKVPLVYVNVALRNWRAFEKAGFHRLYAPGAFFDSVALDFPVSIGGYNFSKSPDEPILVHMQHVPVEPGLSEKDQHRAGRRKLYAMSYDEFETAIIEQLTGMVGPYGFDAERDIAAITVNRWPHGYAYEYNELFDPPEWTPQNGPHLAAREPIGRISIANSDSSALAYVNGAFDAAARAVDEIRDL